MAGIPNLAGINLPALPNPAAGIAEMQNPLLKIVQALGQYPDQQAQAAENQMKRNQLASQQLELLSQQLTSNKAIGKTPQFQNTAKRLYQMMGVPAPTLPDGSLDIDSMMPNSFQKMMQRDPNFLNTVASLPREVKASIPGIPKELADADPVYQMSPGERTFMRRQLAEDYKALAQGDLDVPQFMSWVDINGDSLRSLGVNVDSLLQSDPTVLGKLSAKGTAMIERLQQMGIYDKARAAKAIAEISSTDSLAKLRAVQAKYYTVKTDLLPQQFLLRQHQIETDISLKQQQITNATARLQGYLQNINLHSAQEIFKENNAFSTQERSLQTSYQALLNTAKGYDTASPPQPVPLDLQRKLLEVKAQLDQANSLHDTILKNKANILGKAMLGSGLPSTMKIHSSNTKIIEYTHLQDIARKHNKPINQVVKDYKAIGYQIIGTPSGNQ